MRKGTANFIMGFCSWRKLTICIDEPMDRRVDSQPNRGTFRGAELLKDGILVSRIPDIFGRKLGLFPIVAAKFSIFVIKRLQHRRFMTQLSSK